ncbi:SGNH/GDSL hydrolase family protein [Micromonospora zhanjiangensis]
MTAVARRSVFGLAALVGCTSWGHQAPRPATAAPPAAPAPAPATPTPTRSPSPEAPATGVPADDVVVTFGDSVPAGTACDCVPFPALYARQLSTGARSTNLARSGLTSADIRSQVEDPATAQTIESATVIILMVGANDLAELFDHARDADYQAAADQVEANVGATLDRLRLLDGEDVPILVLGYWNVVRDGDVARDAYGPRTAEADVITGYVNEALRAAAAARSARYVPTLPALKGDDGSGDPTDLLAEDGDHPNARGHAAIAAATVAAQPASH